MIIDMNADITLAIGLGGIATLALLLRTNIALAILGLTAGYVLSDLLTDEIVNYVRGHGLDKSDLPITAIVTIVLILLPAILILIRFKGYQKSRVLQHVVPAVAFALLAGVLILQNLPLNSEQYLRSQSYVYGQLRYFEILIIVITIAIAIIDVLLQEKEHRRKYRKRKRERD